MRFGYGIDFLDLEWTLCALAVEWDLCLGLGIDSALDLEWTRCKTVVCFGSGMDTVCFGSGMDFVCFGSGTD